LAAGAGAGAAAGVLLAGAGAGAADVAAAGDPVAVPASEAGAEPEVSLKAVAGGTAAVLPPRKSVTYQPEPLSWKPAAVTCFLNAGAPH